MNKVDICANESIKAKEFLLIDETGVALGQLSRDRAFEIAIEKNLDLVQVSTTPPVVKLLQLDKYAYQLAKNQKEKRRKQLIVETKTILLKLRIGFDAIEVIKRKARKFFEEGHKVIFTMKLRKKERVKIKDGELVMKKLQEEFSDVATIVKDLHRIGEDAAVSMILSAKKS
jgi:translation initiation factor IF-3